MTTEPKQGHKNGVAGAWLVTKLPDGRERREPLLTFDPFARPGRNHPDGPLDKSRALAWQRERTRCRRAGLAATAKRPPRAAGVRAQPPRLTSAEWRAFHALARARRAEAARRAATGAGQR